MCGDHAPLTLAADGEGWGPHCPRIVYGTCLAACSCGAVLTASRCTPSETKAAYLTHLAEIAPESPEGAPTPCPRCNGSRFEPGTEAEGDWDSAAMRHHPYTGEPCTACNGSGKATGWADQLAAGSLAAAREKFGPTFAPETPEETNA
jgi:hypothetical protein